MLLRQYGISRPRVRPVYKDSDILRYGSLFSVIFQNQIMKFTVDPDRRTHYPNMRILYGEECMVWVLSNWRFVY